MEGLWRADIINFPVVLKKYNPKDEPQLLNELKATSINVGLLINFGEEKVELERFIY